MTAQHTPGPWQIGYGGMDGDDFATITSKFAEYPICQLEPQGYNKANAALIARAPDLLAENQRLREALIELEALAYQVHMRQHDKMLLPTLCGAGLYAKIEKARVALTSGKEHAK